MFQKKNYDNNNVQQEGKKKKQQLMGVKKTEKKLLKQLSFAHGTLQHIYTVFTINKKKIN